MVHNALTIQIIDWNIQKNTISIQEFIEVLQMFVDELPKEEAAITQAFQEKNRDILLKLLHSFKGSCKCCGLAYLESKVDIIYKQFKNDDHFDSLALENFTKACRVTNEEILKFIKSQ